MRIRTANGFGLVRPWSVLVIVLVLVMSGSAAFGQPPPGSGGNGSGGGLGGLFPGGLPGSGGIGGNGGTSNDTELRDCDFECTCTYQGMKDITDRTYGSCTEKIYIIRSATLTRYMSVKAGDCGKIDKNEACRNLQTKKYVANYLETTYYGCGNPPVVRVVDTKQDDGNPPGSIGGITLAPGCHGGYGN